ncbi:MAG: acyl-CoA/acyl-ACP dehydrogenase [Bacteroidales bacterium]|nr:acyl-CoA/acyl-ACP dehydrogenase [Bacteroidales bacterium]
MSHNHIVTEQSPKLVSFDEKKYLKLVEDFRQSMRRAFHQEENIDRFSSTRGLPPAVLKELMSGNPLSLCIPMEYGGLGGDVRENIAFVSEAAYESLALSLTLGINNALFIQPVAKYGQESVKQKVFDQFLYHSSMGGLMITEPEFGSDALNMNTSFIEKGDEYHIKGKKHWAGLTGMADFWVLTARRRTESGSLMRDIDMFICDVNSPHQKIKVEEYFENLGLYQIPYGRNLIDVHIPLEQKLIPQTNGIQMLLDMLHRSRFQFPGMGMGFIKRNLDEAINHAKSRLVGNKKLFDYDQVQQRLSRLQANFTVCSAFCLKSGEVAGIQENLASLGMQANSIKTVTSDIMQESAQSLLQLVGAKGYRLNHIAGRAIVDSRPFQIFEGSNDILYHQIADSALKQMKNAKEKSFSTFLDGFASRATDRIREMVNFDIDFDMPQRKLVDLGQVISRVFSMDLVVYLGEKGFRKDLIDNTLDSLKMEISTMLNNFRFMNSRNVVADYEEGSGWLELSYK